MFWRRVWERAGNLLLGFAAANGLGVLLFWLTKLLIEANPATSGTLTLAMFILIPLLMGIASAFWWRRLSLSAGSYFGYSLLNLAIALTICHFMLGEGIVCLVIGAPLILMFLFCGTLVGRSLFQEQNRVGVCVVPLALVLMVVDARTPRHHEQVVTDRLTIRAAPAQVWRHVLEVPPMRPDSGFWLYRLGLPQPLRTTVDRPAVGGRRWCIFQRQVVLDERIVAMEPGRRLLFDVVGQPRDPEILGHLDILRGEIVLRDNGDGTTTMTGRTWYRLHVYPAAYYELWADGIARNVHASVMGHLKVLAEAGE